MSTSRWMIGRRELLSHPPERVWAALSTAGELRKWLCDDVEVDLRINGHLSMSGGTLFKLPGKASEGEKGRENEGEGEGDFTIVELIPNELLAFSWRLGGQETIVRFELANHLMQTNLTVTQEATDNPGWTDDSETPNWWWIYMSALQSYLDSGSATLRIDYSKLADATTLRFGVSAGTFPWVIWSKLCQPEQLGRWWGWKPRVDARVGGEFFLGEQSHSTQILEIDEAKRLVHDWNADDTQTRIEWTIEATDDDTLIQVEDSGPWPSEDIKLRRAVEWAGRLLALHKMSERGISPRELAIGDSK